MADKVAAGKEIKVNFSDNLKGGSYCNLLFIAHTKEEFILDFMMVAPPTGAVTSRVIMSPGHMKRTIAALQNNLQKYEKSFGALKEAPVPAEERKIGFKTT